jgi:hypothetical protein
MLHLFETMVAVIFLLPIAAFVARVLWALVIPVMWIALGVLGFGIIYAITLTTSVDDWLEALSAVAALVAIYGAICGGPWLLYAWMTRRPVDFEKLNKSLQRDRERVLKSMRRSEG